MTNARFSSKFAILFVLVAALFGCGLLLLNAFSAKNAYADVTVVNVSSADEFLEQVELNDNTKKITLTSDIVLDSQIELTDNVDFGGVIDGNGHEIKLTNQTATSNWGLFSSLENATISNCRIVIDVNVADKQTPIVLAGVAGSMIGSTISNCSIYLRTSITDASTGSADISMTTVATNAATSSINNVVGYLYGDATPLQGGKEVTNYTGEEATVLLEKVVVYFNNTLTYLTSVNSLDTNSSAIDIVAEYNNAPENQQYFSVQDGLVTLTATYVADPYAPAVAEPAATFTTEPAAVSDLVYIGEALALVTAGTSSEGTVQYKLGDGEWSTTIPTAVNAGDYTVYAKVQGDMGYTDSNIVSINVSIAQASNAISNLSITGWTYGDNPNSPSATATYGEINYTYYKDNDNDWVLVASINTPKPSAGYYKVVASVAATDNYAAASAEATFDIIPRTIGINWCEDDFTYNGNVQNISAHSYADETVFSLSVAITQNGVAAEFRNAGEYTATASMTYDTPNYCLQAQNFRTYTMKKANNTITWNANNDYEWTYGDTIVYPTASALEGDVTIEYKLEDADDSSYTTTAPTNAGSYVVRASVAQSTNYNGASDTNNFVITKQQASFSEMPEAYELYYTGNSLVLLSAGESTNGTVQYKLGDGEWTTTRPVATNVGTYTVYAKVVATDTENYIDSDVLEFTASISMDDNEITWNVNNDYEWTYGDEIVYPTASASLGGDVTIEYKLEDADDSTYTTTAPTKVGSYEVRASVADSANYYGASRTTYFEIDKKTIGLIDDIYVFEIYENEIDSFTITLDGVLEGDDVSYELPLYIIDGDGDYGLDIELVGDDKDNYTLGENNSITVRVISIQEINYEPPTANTAEELKTLIFNGQNQNLIVAGTCDDGYFVYNLSEEGEFTTAIPQARDAGDYTVYYRVIPNDENAYYGASGSVDVTISPQTLNVNWTHPSSLNYDGNVKTVSANVEINNEIVNLVVTIYKNTGSENEPVYEETVDSIVNAGMYQVEVNFDSNYADKDNYYLENNTWGYTIGRFTVTPIPPATTSYVYNGEDQTSSVVVQYVLDPEDENEQPKNLVVIIYTGDEIEPVEFRNVGTYNVAFGFATEEEEQNYCLPEAEAYYELDASGSFAFATGEITKKPITKPVEDNTVYTYTGALIYYGITATDDYAVAQNVQRNAGSYTVTVALKDKTNTMWTDETTTDLTFTFTINPKQVAMPDAGNNAFIYTGSELTYEIEPSDDYTVTNNTATDIDDYVAIISLTDPDNTVWADADEGHETDDLTYPFSISAKPKASFNVAPTAASNLIFNNGLQQLLATAGETQNGTAQYRALYKGEIIVAWNTDYLCMEGRNAGDYIVECQVIATDTEHYDDSDVLEIEVMIAQATYDMSNVQIANTEQTYTGDAKTVSVYNVPEGLTATIVYKQNGEPIEGNPVNAGVYNVVVSFTNTNNNFVTPENMEAVLTIAPAQNSISWNLNNWTYGDEVTPTATDSLGANATIVYKVAGADDSTYTATLPENAGTYVAKANVEAHDNYAAAEAIKEFTISPKEIEINWSEDDFTFNGEEQTIYATYFEDSTLFMFNVAITQNGVAAEFRNAGEYTATASFVAPETNYILPEDATKDYTMKILAIAKPVANNTTFTYTGNEQTYSVTTSNYYTITNNTRTDVGSQTVTVSLNDTANTMWTDETTGNVEFTFTISKAERGLLYVKTKLASEENWRNNSNGFVYGDVIILGLVDANGEEVTEGDVTFAISTDSLADNTAIGSIYNNELSITRVGQIYIVASVTESEHYLAGNTNGMQRVEINKATYDVSEAEITVTQQVYNGEQKSVVVTPHPAGVTAVIVYKQNNSVVTEPIHAGEYDVEVSFRALDEVNYENPTRELAGTLTIAKATDNEITSISINNWSENATASEPQATAKYGTPTFSYAVKGSEEFSEMPPADVGEYVLKATVVGTDDYNGAEATFNFEITNLPKAVFSVVPTAKTNLVYDGSEFELVTAGESTQGEVVYSTGNDVWDGMIPAATEAGNYTVYAKVQGDDEHSDSDIITLANITIAKATYDMTGVTFENKTVTYNGIEQSIEITGTLPAGVSVSYENNTLKNAGSTTATANFTGDANYNEIASMTATLTITKKAVVKPVEDTTVYTYTGELIYYGITATDDYAVAQNVQTNAGSYTVTVALKDKTNTMWADETTTDLTFTFTINKLAINKPVATKTSFVYDGEPHSLDFEDNEYKDYYEVYDNSGTAIDDYTAIVSLKDKTNTMWANSEVGHETDDLTYPFSISDKEKAVFSAEPTAIENLVYNGKAQALVTAGESNHGDVVYSTDNANWSEDIPTRIEAGRYTVYAKVAENETYADSDLVTLNITIAQATYDLTNIQIVNREQTYTGDAKTVSVYNVPAGLTPTIVYKQNGEPIEGNPVNAGNYEVVITFTNSNDNYITPDDMETLLTINQATYDISEVEISGTTTVYDGTAKYVSVTGLPQGLTTSITYTKDNETIPAPTNAGVYQVTITFENENINYVTPADMTATLTINKKQIAKPTHSDEVLALNDEEEVENGLVDTADYTVNKSAFDEVGKNTVEIVLSDPDNTCWADSNDSSDGLSYDYYVLKTFTISSSDESSSDGFEIVGYYVDKHELDRQFNNKYNVFDVFEFRKQALNANNDGNNSPAFAPDESETKETYTITMSRKAEWGDKFELRQVNVSEEKPITFTATNDEITFTLDSLDGKVAVVKSYQTIDIVTPTKKENDVHVWIWVVCFAIIAIGMLIAIFLYNRGQAKSRG